MVGLCKVDKKHEIFDFETIVHQLFITRLDSRAGKLLYSRVLQENSKKSGKKYFFVEITSKTQNSQMALENSTYVDFSGGVIFFRENRCRINIWQCIPDFPVVFERTHWYYNLAASEHQGITKSLFTVVRKSEISRFCSTLQKPTIPSFGGTDATSET